MHTSEPGVYAVGDIVLGSPQLAHVGAMEALVSVARIAKKPCKPINPEHIPGATYCHPEIGSVGLTETKAQEAGYNIKVGKFPFTANSRASIVGQHEGFIKIVSDAEYGEILGVHIIGPQAFELISEAVTAMEAEATVEIIPGFPVTVCDDRATALAKATAEHLFGDGAWNSLSSPVMGAEDFAYVLTKAGIRWRSVAAIGNSSTRRSRDW